MPLYGATKRSYQRNWIAERRRAYLGAARCVECGATERLEVHHLDPAAKSSHRVWSWSEPRRLEELSKTEVRCRHCHLIEGHRSGVFLTGAVLTPRQVLEIRDLEGDVPADDLASRFGVARSTILDVWRRRTWVYAEDLVEAEQAVDAAA